MKVLAVLFLVALAVAAVFGEESAKEKRAVVAGYGGLGYHGYGAYPYGTYGGYPALGAYHGAYPYSAYNYGGYGGYPYYY